MAKINLDLNLTTIEGKEIQDGGNPIELGSCLLYALARKEEGQTMAESLEYYALRKLLFKGGEVELTSEQITTLKNKSHAFDSNVFYAIVDLLEG